MQALVVAASLVELVVTASHAVALDVKAVPVTAAQAVVSAETAVLAVSTHVALPQVEHALLQ